MPVFQGVNRLDENYSDSFIFFPAILLPDFEAFQYSLKVSLSHKTEKMRDFT